MFSLCYLDMSFVDVLYYSGYVSAIPEVFLPLLAHYFDVCFYFNVFK